MTNFTMPGIAALRARGWLGSRAEGSIDARRALQLALAALWLLDAALQFQPVMFTKWFGQQLAATATGNPGMIGAPITWDANLVERHAILLDAVFATAQLLLAAGIAWRTTLRPALAASVAWSLGVWWFGEGLGGVLTGTASPVTGAPGAVLLYALLAILLWPADRGGATPPFTAARAVGANAARAVWLVLWLSMACLAVVSAESAPQAVHDTIAGLESGEPGWLGATEGHVSALAASHGLAVAVALATAFVLIAVGIYLSAPGAQAAVLLGITAAAVIWVAGEAFGGILAGGATDPNSGPLLVLLALAYWPSTPSGITNN
jgi:hypothetical protein